MDLWVRSQNRRILSKVSYLQEHFGNGKYGIYDEAIPMGYYETEERALEVLDEIQKILTPIITYKQKEPKEIIQNGLYQVRQEVDMKIQELSTYVYQMPKK